VDCLTALSFMASSAVHAWEFLYGLSAVGSSYQFHKPFFFSATVSEQWERHGAVYFRATCISV
jgi:hypothetical protein